MIGPSRPGVSRSALWLAGALTVAGRHAPWRGARPTPYAETLFRAGADGAGRFLDELSEPDRVAGFLGWFERRFPGFVSHVAPRKRWVADRADGAVASGAASVVVLGGGLDPLSLELARRHPGLVVMDLDREPTSAVKREAYASLGAPDGLRLVAADLAAGSLPAAVSDLPRPMLVVAEGLLEYLVPESVGRLLGSLAAGGMRWLVGSFMAPSALDDPVIRRTVEATRGANAEAFRFMVDASGFRRALDAAGLATVAVLTPGDLAGAYAAGLGLGGAVPPVRALSGFHLAIAAAA